MTSSLSPSAATRRRHPAHRARLTAGALSLAGFVVIGAALATSAASATATTDPTTNPTTTPNHRTVTTPTTSNAGGSSNSVSPSSGPAPVSSSHGS